MATITTTLVTEAHGYTRSRVPWDLEQRRPSQNQTHTGKKYGWKLIHYISGGGMKTFGRTVRQEEAEMKRNRFLAGAALAFVVWLTLLLV